MFIAILFLFGFFYGYGRKKREVEGFGFIGYLILFLSIFLSFLITDFNAELTFEFIFVLLPSFLFVIGYFSGRKMDIF